ncbi:MAG: hypothetical protein P1V13_05920 [Rhizobiaceae bacterium]|nr:hypothetical protein [Rhizobiaceae bacterium]
MALNFADLEIVYEELARTLDRLSPSEREVFLCKLSLLMARDLGDLSRVQAMIQTAQNHLEKV